MKIHIHNRSLVQSLCKIELGPWGGLTPETVIDTMRLTRDRHGVKTVQLVMPLGIWLRLKSTGTIDKPLQEEIETVTSN